MKTSTRLPLLLIFCFPAGVWTLGNSTAGDCRNDIGWKGDNVKAINDCDIFDYSLGVDMTKLVQKTNCIQRVVILIGQPQFGGIQESLEIPNTWVTVTNKWQGQCTPENVTITVTDMSGKEHVSVSSLDPVDCFINETQLHVQETFPLKIKVLEGHSARGLIFMNKLEACLASKRLNLVAIENSKGEEISPNWASHKSYVAEVSDTTDRCLDEVFTVIYRFDTGTKTKKVLVPSQGIGWQGSDAKAINDCDIVEDRLGVNVTRLFNNSNCVRHIGIKMNAHLVDFNWETMNIIHNPLRYKCIPAKIMTTVWDLMGKEYVSKTDLNPVGCFNNKKQLAFESTEKPNKIRIDLVDGVFKSKKLWEECVKGIKVQKINTNIVDYTWAEGTVAEIVLERCKEHMLVITYIFGTEQTREKVIRVPRKTEYVYDRDLGHSSVRVVDCLATTTFASTTKVASTTPVVSAATVLSTTISTEIPTFYDNLTCGQSWRHFRQTFEL